jgi:exodeoxyribonuclease V gamma subunit
MHPTRVFCQRRLNLYLGDDLQALPEREPFGLDHLKKWQLATESLEHHVQGRADASRLEVLRARGCLPHFVSGELALSALQREVSQIYSVFTSITQGATPQTLPVDLRIEGLRIHGSLGDLYPQAHARLQYSSAGKRHELRQFVRYVVLRCVAAEAPRLQLPAQSLLVAKEGKVVRFELPTDVCERALRDMLALYVRAHAAPLPLFAHASRAYAEKLKDGASQEVAWKAARSAFGERTSQPGTADVPEPYVEQVFGDFDQLMALSQESFQDAAERLYEPMLQARSDA